MSKFIDLQAIMRELIYGLTCLWIVFTSIACTFSPVAEPEGYRTSAPFQQALALQEQLRYDTARQLFLTLADQYYATGNEAAWLDAWQQAAHCYWRSYQSQAAYRLADTVARLAALHLPAHDPILAKAYTIMGNVACDWRTEEGYAQALMHYQQALRIQQANYRAPHTALAEAYERLGIARFLMDDYAGAIPYYEQALAMLGPLTPGNADVYSKIYNNLGLQYQGLADYEKAVACFSKAIDALESTGHPPDSRFAKFNKNIGLCRLAQGEPAQAQLILERAWQLEREVGEPGSVLPSYILEGLGDCYFARAEYQRSVGYFQQYLLLWQPMQEDGNNARVIGLHKLGQAHLAMADTSRAWAAFSTADSLVRAAFGADNFARVRTLMDLASLASGRQARSLLQEALSIGRKFVGELHPLMGQLHLALLSVAIEAGEEDEVGAEYQRAAAAFLLEADQQPLLANISSPRDYVHLLEVYGEWSFDHGRNEEAMDCYRRALDLLDAWQARAVTRQTRSWLQEQVLRLVERTLTLAHETGTVEMETIYSLFERSRAVQLKQDLQQDQSPSGRRARQLSRELAHYQQQLNQAPGHLDSFPATFWRRKLLETEAALKAEFSSLEKVSSNWRPVPVQLASLQRQTQAQGETFLMYCWGEKSLFRLVVDTGQASWSRLARTDTLATQLTEWLQLVNQPPYEWGRDDAVQRERYRQFIRLGVALRRVLLPLSLSAGRKLVLLPDGPLYQLPFGALPLSAPAVDTGMDYRSLPYLGRVCPWRLSYSAATYLAPVDRSRIIRGYAGFAPSYDNLPWPPALAPGDSLRLSVLLDAESWSRRPVQLRGAAAEVSEAGRRFSGKAYLGDRATESRFIRELGRAAVIHLAAHAWLTPADPAYSAFLLQPAEGEDGVLFTYEIAEQDIASELAILSACHSGAGPYLHGEGALTLARSFQAAGCPATVLSLWEVDDGTSGTIISQFLQLLQSGSTKSEGLRQALDTYLEREARDWQTHPYFWAHLCLAGQDQPVTLGHGFGWRQRALYGVAGLLLMSLGWWSWRRRW